LETDRNDRLFWQDVIEHFRPDIKLNFSAANTENKAEGVEEILKFLAFEPEFYAQNPVIFCIDSDFRYVSQDTLTQNKKYIFQTYSYAIENHKCIPQNLNRLIRIFDTKFDFCVFLKNYSETIYLVLLYWIDCLRKNKEEQASETVLKPLLSVRPSNKVNLANHAQEDIDILRNMVENWKENLPDTIDFQNLDSYVRNLGIKPEDSFLYINGHILYDNVITQLLEKMKEAARNKYTSELPSQTPKERKQKGEKVNQINKLFEKEWNYKTLLNINYRDCLHSNHCFLIERIGVDIKTYFNQIP